MTIRTLIAAALVALAALVGAPVAGAAAWQGATPISDPAANAGEAPTVALGAAGDAAAIWWDDGAGGRVMLARRPAGGAWSAPVAVASSAAVIIGQVGVDGTGTVTAAFTSAGATRIATWTAAAAAPTVTALPVNAAPNLEEVMTVTSLAVDAAGDAVLAGLGTTNPGSTIFGYRHGAGGTFEFGQQIIGGGEAFLSPKAAINDAGTALVAWRTMTANALYGRVRTATDASWGPAQTSLVPGVTVAGDALSPAVDAAGTAYIAFTVDPAPVSTTRIVAVAVRAAGGGAWLPQLGLSPAGTIATDVSIAVAPTGSSLLVWRQQGAAPLDAKVLARSGSAGTAWGPVETLNDTGTLAPTAVIGKDGRAVAAWMHLSSTGSTPQARVRAADGTWDAVTTIAAEQPGSTATLPLATDGIGDWATVSTPAGAPRRVVVSVYDGAAPTVSQIALSGSPVAGFTLGFGVTATDAWSAVPAPAWSFGDGASGSGTTVSHVYASAGTYTATVTVADASGNAVTRQVTSTIGAQHATLTSARFSAKWTASRVKGTLTVAGSAPRAGSYAVDVFSGKVRKLHAAYTLPPGAFSKALKLPVKLLPGTYSVTLTPAFAANVVTPATGSAKLAAPVEGVVDKVVLSGRNGGPSTRTLKRATTIWASFHFAAVPKGALKLTWYKTVKGKRVALGAATKSPGKKVGSYLRPGGILHGTFTAVLTRKGKVIAQGSVRGT